MKDVPVVRVYTIKKMEELVRLGFHVYKVKDNKDNPQMKVFFFYDEEGISQYL